MIINGNDPNIISENSFPRSHVIDFVIGDFSINILDDKRSGDDRRVKKPRKRKNEKRKTQRRK